MPRSHGQEPHDAPRRAARWAGAVYLALGVATAFGLYHAPLVRDDLAGITRVVAGPDFRFRIAVVSDVVAAALGIPLVVLLYELLAPVGRVLAKLMAGLLAVAVPLSFALALNYVAAHLLLTEPELLSALPAAQREALAGLFLRLHYHGVLAEEIFWGLWLLPFGILVMRSRFLPRLLGILLIVAGVAYVVHSLTSLLLAGPRIPLYERMTMLARAAGEFPIILYLLVKGVAPVRALQADEMVGGRTI